MVKVSEVVPFSGMLAAPKALVIVGGVATVKLAEAVLPVPPLVEVTAAGGVGVLPDAAPVTVTLNWHWLLTAMVPPVRAMLVGAVVVAFRRKRWRKHSATVSPVGSVSVNATPVSATALAAGLVMVNVSDVVAFRAIVED